jgi:prepilin signal peptidase PulO-like enzyme (type II secretory pathway)
MHAGTDPAVMIGILAIASCGALLTQAFWSAACRFGPRETMLVAVDPVTPAIGFVGTAAVACASGEAFASMLSALVVVCAAAVCARTDQATGLVFDVVTGPAFVLALSAAIVGHTFANAACGAFVVGGSLFALYVMTKRRGIGLGDVKLGAVVGVGLGAAAGLTAIGAAFVVGAVIGGVLLASRRIERGAELRFAPYIFCGVVLAAGRVV